jgi:hypothetical protein
VLREVRALAAAGLTIGLICAGSTMSIIKSFVFGMKAELTGALGQVHREPSSPV